MKIYIVQAPYSYGELILVTTDLEKAKQEKSAEFPDTFYIWEFDTETEQLERIDD